MSSRKQGQGVPSRDSAGFQALKASMTSSEMRREADSNHLGIFLKSSKELLDREDRLEGGGRHNQRRAKTLWYDTFFNAN